MSDEEYINNSISEKDMLCVDSQPEKDQCGSDVSSTYHSDTEIPCFTVHVDDLLTTKEANRDAEDDCQHSGRDTSSTTGSDISSTYHSDTEIPCYTINFDDSSTPVGANGGSTLSSTYHSETEIPCFTIHNDNSSSSEETNEGSDVSSTYHSDTEIPCFTVHVDDLLTTKEANRDAEDDCQHSGRDASSTTDSDISSTYHSDTEIPCYTIKFDDSSTPEGENGSGENDQDVQQSERDVSSSIGSTISSTYHSETEIPCFTIHNDSSSSAEETDEDCDIEATGRKGHGLCEEDPEPKTSSESFNDIAPGSGFQRFERESVASDDPDMLRKLQHSLEVNTETDISGHEHVTPDTLKQLHVDDVQVDQPTGRKILKIRGDYSEPESQDETDDEANVIREQVPYEENVDQPSWLDISEDVPISNIEDENRGHMLYEEDVHLPFWLKHTGDVPISNIEGSYDPMTQANIQQEMIKQQEKRLQELLIQQQEKRLHEQVMRQLSYDPMTKANILSFDPITQANIDEQKMRQHELLRQLSYDPMTKANILSFDPITQANIVKALNKIHRLIGEDFISTYAGRTAAKLLKRSGAVFIKGRAGTGKTWLGLTLLNKMKSKQEISPIMIQSPEDWSPLQITLEKRSNSRFVLLIDDIFGDLSLTNLKLSRWKRCFESMDTFVKSRRLFLVITSRPEIGAMCEGHLTTHMHNIPTILQDDGEYSLRENEKENILSGLSKENSLKIIGYVPSEFELKEILATKTVLGFPKLCTLLKGHNDYLSCFRDQTEFTMPYIRAVIENDTLAYHVFLLLMVHYGCIRHHQLNPETVERPSDIWIEKLQKYCFIPTKPTLADIKAKTDSFCGVFLMKTNEGYVFKDSSVYDSLFIIVSKLHPEILIPCSRVDTLLKLVRTDIEDITLVSERTVYLTSQHYDLLADRVTELLLSDDSLDIVRHPSLCHKKFAEHLFTRWKLQMNCKQILQRKISSEQIVTHNPFLARTKKQPNLKLFTCDWLISKMVVERRTHLAHLLINNETQSGNKLGEEYLSQLLACAVYVRDTRLVKLLRQHDAKFTLECFHALCGGRNMSENIDEICYSIVQEFFSTEHVKDMFCLAVLNGSHILVSVLMDTLKLLPQNNTIISDSLVCLFEELGNDNTLKVFAPYNMKEMSKIITILLQSGCEVDASYLLWLAASHTDATALKLIIPLGVNVTRKYRQLHSERQWTTPLHQAAAYGGTDCVYVLLRQMSKTFSEGPNKHAKTPTADDTIDDDSGNSKKTSKFEENIQKTEQVLDKDELLKTGILNELSTNDMGYQNTFKFISKRESLALLSKDPLLDSSCGTALHFAFRDGRKKIINILTEAGCDENGLDDKGFTPVDWAVQNLRSEVIQYHHDEHTKSILSIVYDHMGKKSFDRIRMNTFIKEMFQRNPTLLQPNAFHRDGKSWLHFVAEVVHDFDFIFLPQMAELKDRTDKYGQTPLHVACENGYMRVVKMLCESIERRMCIRKTILTVTDNVGETVIHKAARSDRDSMEKLLYLISDKHVPVDKQDIYGRTALFPAVESGDVEVVELLTDNGLDINTVDNLGQNLVYTVSKMICESQQDKYFLVLQNLLESGVDPNRPNNNQVSPLHLVVMSNFESTKLYTKLARTLIDGGSCVNITDAQLRTPLHIAAGRGLKGLTNLLIETDVDVSLKDFKGRTALHYASGRSNTAIISILLRAGADPCDTDQENKTPLHQAAENGAIENFNLLLDKGSDPDTQDTSGRVALHYAVHSGKISAMATLLEKGADINKQDKDGRTGLHLAAKRGSCASTRLFLGYNADPVIEDRAGQTALHYSAKRGCRETVKLLLEKGADPSVQDVSGRTVLHCAAAVFGKAPFFDFNQALNVLSDLVKSGANPSVLDNQGQTATDIIQDLNSSTSRSVGYYKTRALTILTN